MSTDGTPRPASIPSPPPHDDHPAALSGAVRAVSGVTLLSRVGGLIRNIVVGKVFGDTLLGSAFAAAFQIPNMFRRLLGEGALSAAFIPEYARLRATDPQAAGRLASLVVAALGVVASLIAIAAELVLLAILLIAPGDDGRQLSIHLIMVIMPFMPPICMVAVLAGMLQVHGKFAAASSGPLILNAFIIGVGGYFIVSGQLAGTSTAYVLGAATVLSGFTQLFWFARLLRPHVRWTLDYASAVPAARTVFRRFVPVAVGMGTLQLNAMVDVLIAMVPIWFPVLTAQLAYPLDKKSNVILSLTQQLYQFPLGVFGIAVATAIFPMLARQANEPGPFLDTLRRGLRLSLFIGAPASAGLVLIRHDLTAALFGWGKTPWSDDSLARAAAVLMGFAPAVWAYSLNHVLTRAFYARGDTRTPMRIAVAMVCANIALNMVLIWWLREAGLAWSTSLCAVVQCLLLIFAARKIIGPASGDAASPRVIDGATGRAMFEILLATTIMAGLTWLAISVLPHGRSLWWRVIGVAEGAAVGGVSYLAICRSLRIPELGWLTSRVVREHPSAYDPKPPG